VAFVTFMTFVILCALCDQVVFRRSVVLQSMLKSLHREGAKRAEKTLPSRLFSVSSVLSVAPW